MATANKIHCSILSSLLVSSVLFAQKTEPSNASFQVIDIAQKELRIINAYKDADSAIRSKVFADSLYHPHKSFWSGYIGGEQDFVEWVNTKVLRNVVGYNMRNQQVNGEALMRQLNEVKAGMEQLTGYSPKGAWYVVYGPAWANLGGLSGGTMFIDLSHPGNSTNDKIMMMFPHELTHQIYSNVNTHMDTTALGSIINEGFAVFMNQLYWKNDFTLAEHLGYPEAGLKAVEEQEDVIRKYFEEHKYSTDAETINVFRNRSARINKDLPGAIGYYIGYRIVEQYVKKFGPDSWKDVFTKSPKEIYTLSGY